jgi:hypothetical protein
MNMHWITGSAAAFAIGVLMSSGGAQAAMSPAVHYDTSNVQRVDCAVGFHLGPAGACIIGTEEHHEKVIERRATDDGCETKTVHRSDGMGNSETRSKTNCD